MIDIYILDGNLEYIGIIDDYISLIWVNRYNDEGDCELYIEASEENLLLLKKGNYLTRLDDDMVCRIEKIELETDADGGNYIIVTGYDAKRLLARRIIWNTTNINGNVEDYVRTLVTDNIINPEIKARQIKNLNNVPNFFLDEKANFQEIINEQVSYRNLEEKIQEICKKYGWGYKVTVRDEKFYFSLYSGTDRTNTVIFSTEFENLISTNYVEDDLNTANVALIGGEGEGSNRIKSVSGYADGINRAEIFVDAKDISKTITFNELIETYPKVEQNGQGYLTKTELGKIVYQMHSIDIAIIDNEQLENLKKTYSTGEVVNTSNGNSCFRLTDVIIADLPEETDVANVKDTSMTVLRDLIYSSYLLNRGYEKLGEMKPIISFSGQIEPNSTFKYKEDYFLGDIVTIQNQYGIEAETRIVEIKEVYDEHGYSFEPIFENTGVTGQIVEEEGYLLEETGEHLKTEDDDLIKIEHSQFFSQINKIQSKEIQPKDIQPIAVNEEGSKRISELPNVTDIEESSVFPVVAYGETSKISYADFKLKLDSDLKLLSQGLNIINLIYPVGSVITNSSPNFDPNDVYSGTKWIRIKGRVIVGLSETEAEYNAINKAGGIKTINLSHAHTMNHIHNIGHTHDIKHTHNMSHTHTLAHTHTLSHTHTLAHTHSTGNHTLTISEIPSHNHTSHLKFIYDGGQVRGRGVPIETSTAYYMCTIPDPNYPAIYSVGGSGSHNHGNTGQASNQTTSGASTITTSGASVTTTSGANQTTTGNSSVVNTAGANPAFSGDPNYTNTGTAGNTAQNILNPYIVKYIWERTE